MSSRTKNMTQGNPTRLILHFSLPLLAGTVLQQLYNIVDTMVVGRGEGVTALAAVSSTGWLDWTLLGLILGLAQGFSIRIAHCFGAGNEEGRPGLPDKACCWPRWWLPCWKSSLRFFCTRC